MTDARPKEIDRAETSLILADKTNNKQQNSTTKSSVFTQIVVEIILAWGPFLQSPGNLSGRISYNVELPRS